MAVPPAVALKYELKGAVPEDGFAVKDAVRVAAAVVLNVPSAEYEVPTEFVA